MTDLQIGLLVIGAAAVAGVLVYNRLQERATRRAAERAFGAKHAEVLMGGGQGERREPTFDAAPAATTAAPVPPPPPSAARPASPPPDPRIDYVLELQGTSAGALRPEWVSLQRRF